MHNRLITVASLTACAFIGACATRPGPSATAPAATVSQLAR